ncbi:MAG: hypothetical protein IJY08_00550 [Clostridia bacterium]|nr:hypothetical protein [Clostridia bacterium]
MSIALKIVKRVIVALFSLVIAAVIAVLMWRILSSGDPSSMKVISANDAIGEAYEAQGKELYMFRQDQRSITSGENNYSYFSVTNYVIIPDANQIQAVVRYNNSTLRHTAEDFGLSETPSREDNVYDVTVLVAIDLTPDVEEDNSGNDPESVRFVRCHGTLAATDTRNMYNYRRFVFELDDAELDISELMDSGTLLAVYTDIYYVGALDYEATPYGTLCLYDFKSENVRVELSRKDIKAIEAFGD